MAGRLETTIGRLALRNPLIAGPADHFIDDEGVRRALQTGVGAIVLKSINETQSAKDQLQSAEYAALDEYWKPVAWGPNAPHATTIACRTGLGSCNRSSNGSTARCASTRRRVPATRSQSRASSSPTWITRCSMARQIEQAGIRVLELNIGTPYASEARKGTVTTELNPQRVEMIVSAVRKVVSIPLWVKTTGQSERVPELADAAFRAGAELGRHGGPPAWPHSRCGNAQAAVRHRRSASAATGTCPSPATGSRSRAPALGATSH